MMKEWSNSQLINQTSPSSSVADNTTVTTCFQTILIDLYRLPWCWIRVRSKIRQMETSIFYQLILNYFLFDSGGINLFTQIPSIHPCIYYIVYFISIYCV